MTSVSDVDQENTFQGKRGLRNGPSSASKRPALTSITNMTGHRFGEDDQSKKPVHDDRLPVISAVSAVPSSMPSLTNLFSNPNTSLSNALQYTSFEDSAFSMSTSILSFSSPGVMCSPMLVSSSNDQSMLDLTGGHSEVFGEYSDEIYANLKLKESILSPPPGFIYLQPDINANMRAILIDWLIEVAEEFQLHLDTLYLAVAYTDRYLSKVSVPRSKLQLVGTTSLYLAAKFEEIHPPDIGEFAYITDDTYTKKQIVKLEQDMLKVLMFQLVQPTIHTFLTHYIEVSRLDSCNDQVDYLARYLGELCLLDVEPFSKYAPSIIASSAVCLARHTLSLNAWPLSLQTHTGYTLGEINQCLQDLHRAHALAHCHSQQAVRQKYLTQRYLQIARLNSPETLPC